MTLTKTQQAIIKTLGIQKATLPILKAVKVKDGTLTATNLNTFVLCKIANTENGIHNIVNNELIKTNITLEDYPVVPEINTTTYKIRLPDNFLKLINFVEKDDKYNSIQNILLQSDNTGFTILTATDGKQLLYIPVGITTLKSVSLLIHPEVFKILDILKTYHITLSYNIDENKKIYCIKITTEDVVIITRNCQENFPEYKQIFPSKVNNIIKLNKKEFYDAVKYLAGFLKSVNEKQRVIKLEFQDKLKLSINTITNTNIELKKDYEISYFTESKDNIELTYLKENKLSIAMPIVTENSNNLTFAVELLLNNIDAVDCENVYLHYTNFISPFIFSGTNLHTNQSEQSKPKENPEKPKQIKQVKPEINKLIFDTNEPDKYLHKVKLPETITDKIYELENKNISLKQIIIAGIIAMTTN